MPNSSGGLRPPQQADNTIRLGAAEAGDLRY